MKVTIDSGLAQMPSSFLSLAEMNVRQAREAFDGFICASRRGAALLEWRATAVQSGANDIRQMSIGFAERNVIASLNFAQRLVQAESVPQIVDLQTAFVRSQMQRLAEEVAEWDKRS